MKKQLILKLLSIGLVFVTGNNTYAQTPDSLKKIKRNWEGVLIAGRMQGDITKDELLNSSGLILSEKVASIFHMKSFKMTLVVKESEPKEFDNEKNGELTDSMRDAIKNAPAGSKIYFEYITCVDKDNLTRKLHAIALVLK